MSKFSFRLSIVILFGTLLIASLSTNHENVLARAPQVDPITLPPNSTQTITPSSIITSPLQTNWIFARFSQSDPPRYSNDGGKNWSPVLTTPWTDNPHGDFMVTMVPKEDITIPPRMIVLVDSLPYQMQNGLYRSGDLGESWANTTFDIHSFSCTTPDVFFTFLYTMPANPNLVYLGGYCYEEYGGFPPGSHIVSFSLESTDRGVSWTESPFWFLDFAISPGNMMHVYAKQYDGWYESINGGDSWTKIVFSISPNRLIIGANNFLYGITDDQNTGFRSQDGGKTWATWGIPPECSGAGNIGDWAAHPTTPGWLLMRCGNSRVMRSLDYGSTWNELTAPVGWLLNLDYGTSGRLLGVSDCNTSSAQQCGGLWASNDWGSTWYQLSADFLDYRKYVYLPIVSQ